MLSPVLEVLLQRMENPQSSSAVPLVCTCSTLMCVTQLICYARVLRTADNDIMSLLYPGVVRTGSHESSQFYNARSD
jgi:hypothetical protein